MYKITHTDTINLLDGTVFTYTVHRLNIGEHSRKGIFSGALTRALPALIGISEAVLDTYSALVFADLDPLTTQEGRVYSLPAPTADISLHVQAFSLFLETDPLVVNHVAAAWNRVNGDLAPDYLKPPEQMTSDEKVDPDFLPQGAPPNSASNATPAG